MTEDWRKDTRWADYKDDNENIPEEMFFVYEFLTFSKAIPAYRIKRRLRDHEIDVLSLQDQKKYLKLEDNVEKILQLYLRDNSKKLLIELNNQFKDLLIIIIKYLKIKKIVFFDLDKIASKYSRVPFIGKVQNLDAIFQYNNWDTDIKFQLVNEPTNTIVDGVEKILVENEEEIDVKQTNKNEDLVGKLKKLKRLHKSGTLTKDEFEKAKNKLLK